MVCLRDQGVSDPPRASSGRGRDWIGEIKKYGFNKPNLKSTRAMEMSGHRPCLGFNPCEAPRKLSDQQLQMACWLASQERLSGIGPAIQINSPENIRNLWITAGILRIKSPNLLYVFRRTGATWVQEAYLKDSGAGSNFGSSIGMNGDTIVVGAPAEASPVTGVVNGPWSSLGSGASWAGAAYVFYRKGPTAVIIQQSFSQADPTTAFPITFTVEFSKKIDPTTFNTADITQTGTATGVNWTITNTGDDRGFTLTATSSSTNGTIIPTIPASAVVDVDGNSNAASSPNFDNSVTKNP